jgi:ABC-type glycerol-3-phosphate transport system substrate-binding protein
VAGASALALAGTQLGARSAYTRQGQQFSGKIRFQAGHYTPSESMEKSANNPVPIKAMQDAVDAYRQLQPDVEIEFVRVPEGTDARVWTVTQLTGGNAPEIVWTQSFDTNRDVGKGWWANLNPYMEQPNPYVEAGQAGSEQWIDQFFEGPTGAKYAANGELYVVPYDLVTTFFFYNKSLFEAAGVEVPTTYAGFIDVIAKLKDSGTVAYNGMQWSQPQLGEMVIGAWKDQIEPTGGGGAYTQKDISLAILDGVYDATKPEYKDWLRLMNDSVPYWSEQWPVADAADQFELQFTQGQLAVFEDGSWRFGLLKANDALEFEWGSFFMPVLEKGTGVGLSEYATGLPAPSIGGATACQYGVTNTAEKNGNLDLVVDFLRFITAPTQATAIIAEKGQFLPNIKDVAVNEDLAGPLEAVASGVGEAGMIAYADKIDAEASANITTATQNYLLGRADLDETAEEIQDLLYAQAEKAADDNGWR